LNIPGTRNSTTQALPPAKPTVEAPSLVPSLGLFTTMMLVIGGVIGSGIFRKPGIMAAALGSPELLLLVWVLAGAITLFGALTYAELAAMIPETGGQYAYYERMYGPFVAYLFGWSVFAVIQTGSIAAVSYVFAEYATWFVTLPDLQESWANITVPVPLIGSITPFRDFGVKCLAGGLIAVLTIINYVGVKFGGLVQNIFSIAKIVGMLGLVVAGFAVPGAGHGRNLVVDSVVTSPGGFALVAAIVAALQGAFWAYDGWNKVTFVSGEVRAPQRNLPLALVWGMLAVTAIYLLMNAAYVYVMPIDEMAKSKLVAGDVAERCFRGGGRWVAVTVMLSTLGAVNAIILSTARVYFAMSQSRVFPAFVGRVHPRFRTPAAALVIQAIWSVGLLCSGTFDMLTDTLIFVSWIFYGLGAYGLFVLRRKDPQAPRPYKVPGYPWIPWLFIVSAAIFLAFTIYNDLVAYRTAVAAGKPAVINFLLGGALVFVGAPLFFYYRGRP
jgi:APA family basic amino acid/polyamine antiporter